MLVNITELKDMVSGLLAEYDANIKIGKKPSQIKVRIDCILVKLDKCFGTTLVGKPTDDIRECSIAKKEYLFDD